MTSLQAGDRIKLVSVSDAPIPFRPVPRAPSGLSIRTESATTRGFRWKLTGTPAGS